MIKESTIERVLARLESGQDDFNVEVQDFTESQPYLMAYLTNEDTEAFTEVERELLLFAAIVIYQSVDEERIELPPIKNDTLTVAEELNYEILARSKGNFRDRLTPFFEQSKEEELLAFIEDLVVAEAEETEGITREAREPLFITLKTLVDVLTA